MKGLYLRVTTAEKPGRRQGPLQEDDDDDDNEDNEDNASQASRVMSSSQVQISMPCAFSTEPHEGQLLGSLSLLKRGN